MSALHIITKGDPIEKCCICDNCDRAISYAWYDYENSWKDIHLSMCLPIPFIVVHW